jgi:two-component system chemotaxis response regulator CheB
MIKVVIVEDSPVAREFLTYILTSDPAIQVVGIASNGVEALSVVARLRPDVITMDIHMPVMDGFEATRHIMETVPTPIVIVSGSTTVTEVASTFRAIEAGALAVVLRPPGMNHAAFEASEKELLRTVKLMSEIKVVRRIPRPAQKPAPASAFVAPLSPTSVEIQLVAIGASTGGPPALQKILSRLPADFSVPILIVQHIAAGFVTGFAEWLAAASGFPVRLASHDEVPRPGYAYVAPDGVQMGVARGPVIVLSDHPTEHGLRPSVAYLFRCVAQVLGPGAVGVLLTGMGRDGADELKMMKGRGAITVAQDKESSIVHGMPGEAIKLGAATHILPPEEIASLLVALVKNGTGDSHER